MEFLSKHFLSRYLRNAKNFFCFAYNAPQGGPHTGQTDYILQISGINKSFSGVPALTNVGFNVRRGTVHALMGENGAGKSTMMKILLGIYTRDSGTIFLMEKMYTSRHLALLWIRVWP